MPIDLRKELTDLRRSILTMGSVVEQRVDRALESLVEEEVEIARTVRHGDRQVDEMDIDIEQECMRVLALSQPVAADLRFILAVLRLNTDLERIADEAKSIAKRVIDISKTSAVEHPPILRKMADATRRMLRDALTAFAEEDAALCRAVLRSDDEVDRYQREMFEWCQNEIPRHVESTRAAIDLLFAARRLERIGDLATNIAEDVIFIIEGESVRHTGGQAPRAASRA